MPKSSLEKQLEKNRLDVKRQAERTKKDEQKRLKQENELALKAAIRERASSIVNGQEIIDGFRILDPNAEVILNCLLENCENRETGRISFENSIFPDQFQASLGLELEKLTQYGMLSVFKRFLHGGIVDLLPSAFSYYERKEKAMLKKSQGVSATVEHNYYGNTNVIAATVDSSTIIAGNGNTVSFGTEGISTDMIQESVEQDRNLENTIFISHRSNDKDAADIVLDFFVGTGIPRDAVFCSSLPGNDVKEKISGEVKRALQSSRVNIAILSNDYYESAYCLNEAGILWFLDDSLVIPLALPEITHDKMLGFLNDEYKIRRLNCEEDIAYIYDAIIERLGVPQAKIAVIREETKKLIGRYEAYLSQR